MQAEFVSAVDLCFTVVMVPPKGARKEWGKSACCFKLDPVTHIEGRAPVWLRAKSVALSQQWVRRLLGLQHVLTNTKGAPNKTPLEVDMSEIHALKAGKTPFFNLHSSRAQKITARKAERVDKSNADAFFAHQQGELPSVGVGSGGRSASPRAVIKRKGFRESVYATEKMVSLA